MWSVPPADWAIPARDEAPAIEAHWVKWTAIGKVTPVARLRQWWQIVNEHDHRMLISGPPNETEHPSQDSPAALDAQKTRSRRGVPGGSASIRKSAHGVFALRNTSAQLTVNGPATPPPLDLAKIRPGLVAGTFPFRSRTSQAPPTAGGTAAVTVAMAPGMAAPMLPSALARYSVMVAPTTEAEPVIRKSLPALYFAVPMLTVSVIAVGVTAFDRGDSAPNPPAFLAFTVKVYSAPAVRFLIVMVLSAVSIGVG